jgi:hypothetical protein
MSGFRFAVRSVHDRTAEAQQHQAAARPRQCSHKLERLGDILNPQVLFNLNRNHNFLCRFSSSSSSSSPPSLPPSSQCHSQFNTPLVHDRDDQLQPPRLETPATAPDPRPAAPYRALVVALDAQRQGHPRRGLLPRTLPAGLETCVVGEHPRRRYVSQSRPNPRDTSPSLMSWTWWPTTRLRSSIC